LRIAENFRGWIATVRDCLEAPPLPADTDSETLATYATMEGGVMLSRSYGSVDPFDRTVKALREHFRLLMQKPARAKR
jgi:TetR/AcrR family transcriptional regulator, transcriptional repressor for nem operon